MELIKIVPENLADMSLSANVFCLIFLIVATIAAFTIIILLLISQKDLGFSAGEMVITFFLVIFVGLFIYCSILCAQEIHSLRTGESIKDVYYYSIESERDKRQLEVDYEIIEEMNGVVRAVKREDK